MSVKRQYCEYCGDFLGEFAWSRSRDGRLTCGRADCNREERNDELAEREEAADRAREDNYERYR